MKKILFLMVIAVFTAAGAVAQDAAQQQIDKLTGQIQDLLEAQAQQGKRIEALTKEISELREKVNTPAINDSASREDLKKLATQMQEMDDKRIADNERIIKTMEALGKVTAGTSRKPPVTTSNTAENPGPSVPQKGYEYKVQSGDTLGAIVKAYRAQGVKVTTAQIIAANPKINPDVLIVGKTIFIPDAAAK